MFVHFSLHTKNSSDRPTSNGVNFFNEILSRMSLNGICNHHDGHDPKKVSPIQILTFNLFSCTGHLSQKSDVYSFGVVLLEMLCGRRAVDKNRPAGEHNLVEWARPHLTSKRKILQVMDPRIQGQYSLGGALKLAKLAICCLSTEPKYRPTMNEVVRALEQLQASEEAKANETSSEVQHPPSSSDDSKHPRSTNDNSKEHSALQ